MEDHLIPLTLVSALAHRVSLDELGLAEVDMT